jgi:hypothetical protein
MTVNNVNYSIKLKGDIRVIEERIHNYPSGDYIIAYLLKIDDNTTYISSRQFDVLFEKIDSL